MTSDTILKTSLGTFPYYEHLREVPDGVTALIRGSSGIHKDRCIELVTQGKSTADILQISSGKTIKIQHKLFENN